MGLYLAVALHSGWIVHYEEGVVVRASCGLRVQRACDHHLDVGQGQGRERGGRLDLVFPGEEGAWPLEDASFGVHEAHGFDTEKV